MSSLKNKKVLVTGAAGLIGSRVCQNLLQQGATVFAADNFSIGTWNEKSNGLSWIKLDVCSERLNLVFDEIGPDAVVHCAAHPGGKSLQEPVADVQVNALGSMRIFEWCARNKAQVVYLSSSAVYGSSGSDKPIEETTALQPGTIYAVCKVACENYLRILGEGYGLNWVVLRLFATYGAGHTPNTHQGIINIVVTQLLNNGQVILKGSANRVRDVIYVNDAARAITMSVLNTELSGKIFNVGSGVGVTIGEMVHESARIAGLKSVEYEIVEQPGTVGDPFYNVADCREIEKLTGFKCQYSLSDGLTELIRHRLALKG